jgi:predicted ArsR family transcriptional regulator
VDAAFKDSRKRLRQAILAQLSRQQMTFLELADELDHIAPANHVKRELLRLVGQDLVCSLETKGYKSHDRFETWESAMERVKAKGKGRRQVVATRTRRGERVG